MSLKVETTNFQFPRIADFQRGAKSIVSKASRLMNSFSVKNYLLDKTQAVGTNVVQEVQSKAQSKIQSVIIAVLSPAATKIFSHAQYLVPAAIILTVLGAVLFMAAYMTGETPEESSEISSNAVDNNRDVDVTSQDLEKNLFTQLTGPNADQETEKLADTMRMGSKRSNKITPDLGSNKSVQMMMSKKW